MGKGSKQPVSSQKTSRDPLLAQQGLGELRTLPFALCLASPSSDIWEQYAVLAQPRGVLDSEEWSGWGRRGWQALRLGQLGSLIPSNRNGVLPWFGCAPRGMVPSGSPQPAPGTQGCSQGAQSPVALPRLCSISHCRGWAASPPPPPSFLSAASQPTPASAVIPAGCAEKRGAEPALLFVRAANWEKLQDIHPHRRCSPITQAGKPRSCWFRRNCCQAGFGKTPPHPAPTHNAAPRCACKPSHPLQTSNFHSRTHHSPTPQFAL